MELFFSERIWTKFGHVPLSILVMETVKTVDQALPLVGEIGIHQILVVAIFSLLTVPGTFQAVIILFYWTQSTMALCCE